MPQIIDIDDVPFFVVGKWAQDGVEDNSDDEIVAEIKTVSFSRNHDFVIHTGHFADSSLKVSTETNTMNEQNQLPLNGCHFRL
jgi:hypothetical protein